MEKTGSMRTNYSSAADAELIRQALHGKEAAFLELFNRYKGSLKAHVSKLVQSWDVEDICMQTFLKAFLHLQSYDPEKGEFRTWLFTIGWNTALDHVGRKKREMDCMPTTSIDTDGTGAAGISTGERSPEETISNQEDYDKLIRYIDGLSPLYREIARDRFIDECDYSEIAEKHDIPLNTVKTRISRAKEQLQKMMNDEEDL